MSNGEEKSISSLMSKPRSRRVLWLLAILVVVAGFGFSLFKVFSDNLVFFYTPSQILNGDTPKGQKSYRLGGMVVVGSVQREPDSLLVRFVVSDKGQTVPVEFKGILPDLFKEGTGVVADGAWNGQVFTASEVLAKHDENYMPPGVEK
ncbi:MAG: cytochrome c maturation protein CcmE [Limnobacter sp.]|nr:cytochrome c maturation protein CcmE [Limnobacter sp.]